MIAVDSSTWVAFLTGKGGGDVILLDKALGDKQVQMVPVVLTELLSDPKLQAEIAKALLEVVHVEIEPGYWQRAGELRAKILARGRRARLGDTLIAQACIDGGLALLTRDEHFRAFAEIGGLDLIPVPKH